MTQPDKDQQNDVQPNGVQRKSTRSKKKRPGHERAGKPDWDVLNIIRYGILAVLLVYIGALLAVKGGSNASFEKVSQAVIKAADTSGMTEAGFREIKRFYGLNAKDYEDVMLYYTNQTMGVEELLVVKASSEEEAQAVEAAAQTRLETQIDNFEGYGAEQVKLLKSAVVKTRGTFVFMAVSPNADKFDNAFRKSL